MTGKEIKNIIRRLKNNELRVMDVPEEVKYHKDIIKAERKYGLRIEGNRGYDVINNCFFVEEELQYTDALGESRSRSQRIVFETMDEYYDFLDGDIYENGCYRFIDIDRFTPSIKKNKIDVTKLLERTAFIDETIDDICVDVSEEEIESYDVIESNKKTIKLWIKKFEACTTGAELEAVVDKYNKSKLAGIVDVSFYFYQYIFKDKESKKRFAAIMEYMCTGKYPEYKMINALCSIYGAENVIENYDYCGGAKQTNYKHKRKLKDYVQLLESGAIQFKYRRFFDKSTHYYCEEVAGFEDGKDWPIVRYQRYFETFDEFIAFTEGSLKGTDLSADIKSEVDYSKYETNENTRLPISAVSNLKSTVIKEYSDNRFFAIVEWFTETGLSVKKKKFSTHYLFDFVHYLNGDLSNADLVFCDGLENMTCFDGINFIGAKMTSKMCEKFGIAYSSYKLNDSVIQSFDLVESNEEETRLALADNESKEISNLDNSINGLLNIGNVDRSIQRIHYITDLHLMHRLQNAKCKSLEDVRYVIEKIVDTIVREAGSVLLIGGDVSSEFAIFEIFVKLLKVKLDQKRFVSTSVIFILGNHELWEFPGKTIDEIVGIYRKLIEENEMYLIHDEILYKNTDDKFQLITSDNLENMNKEDIRNLLKSSRLTIFGGLGFAGYNDEFNANQDIYRNSLDRAGEVLESKRFERLYQCILPNIFDKNTIVFTHNPKKDWCTDSELYKDVVYISGHTHRNEFYDDGDYRVYSDNQIGYRNEHPHLKSILISNEYDCFVDYKDGIYEITGAEYNDFYRGKNIQMTFNRTVYILYMLKKNGYYCFIHKAKNGYLSMLNGGALKRLDEKDINYYYMHMDEVISYIRGPLDKYMEIMESISDEIKKLGGSGSIHGCIIDIDWYNHVYVNPVDFKVTGYWALNIVEKYVYPDVPSLLEAECPALYGNYLKLIEENNSFLVPVVKKNEVGVLPYKYLDTDIYKVSREIKKMQKLRTNILSSWYESLNQNNAIESND